MADQKRQILLIHNGDQWLAGSERSLLLLVDGLGEQGFGCSVLCNNRILIEACQQRGVTARLYRNNLLFLPVDKPRLNPIPFLRTVSAIRQFAKEQNIQLIHSNNVLPSQAAFVAARSLRIPIVAHVRGDRYYRASRYGSFIRWCDSVICVSRQVSRNYWPEKLGERLRVIYNGIAPEAFENACGAEFREKLVSGETQLVGTAAFLRPEKAVQNVVELAGLAAEAGADCHFVIAGDGPEKTGLLEMVKARGLSDMVTFLGYVENIPGFLKALDVFVLTSGADAFPGALLQAGAAGLPSVATVVGGVPEIVEDGVTGYLAPSGDMQTMWKKLQSLLGDRQLQRNMGDAARTRIKDRFSIRSYVDQIVDVYEGLL